jgi:hypothetical protein
LKSNGCLYDDDFFEQIMVEEKPFQGEVGAESSFLTEKSGKNNGKECLGILCDALPHVCLSVLRRDPSYAKEDLNKLSATVAGNAAQPSPRSNAPQHTQELEQIRESVCNSLENLFMTNFSRLTAVTDEPFVSAAIFAIEIEDELFRKYDRYVLHRIVFHYMAHPYDLLLLS